MRARPDVSLRISRDAHPGHMVLADLTVVCRAPTPIEGIALSLAGEELVRLEGQRAERRRFLSLAARAAAEQTLDPGEHRYRVSFPLPEDTPCSYHGIRVEIRYALRLQIPVAWWLGVDETYDVPVSAGPAPRPARAPLATTTERGDAPFLEVALDDHAFEPGEEIAGAVAVGNLRGRRIRGVELSLVGFERLRGIVDRAVEAHRFSAELPAGGLDEGRELPFRFQVPLEAAPSFDAGGVALFWCFEVRAALARAQDIVHAAPILLGVFDRPAAAGARRRAIGSGRWRAVWEAAGAPLGLALDPEDLRLAGAFSGCAAAAWIDARGALAGELCWEDWGLDLSTEPRWDLFGELAAERARARAGDEPPGEALFDRFYRVHGRDPGQVRAIMAAPLRRALAVFDEVELGDARVKVASRAPGHDQPWVGEFLAALAALAAEIAAASARVPPPGPMTAMLPAWEAFARDLRGRLEVGRMCIRGAALGGATFSVETCFGRSPEPERTVITLLLTPPLPAAIDPDDPAALSVTPPAVQQLVRAIRARARALEVAEEAVQVTLPAPLPDPASVLDLMGDLLLLAQRLRGHRDAGPYR